MKMQTRDGVADNISWIAEKFPNCVTEKIDAATGEIKLAVDFDMLRQELSSEVVEGKDGRYLHIHTCFRSRTRLQKVVENGIELKPIVFALFSQNEKSAT